MSQSSLITGFDNLVMDYSPRKDPAQQGTKTLILAANRGLIVAASLDSRVFLILRC